MKPRRKSAPLLFVLAALGCGPAAAWTPPPAKEVPAAPRPDELRRTAPSPATATATATAAPIEAAPSPIPGDLPADLDAKLVTHAVCKDRECLVPGLYPAGAAADGGAPAAMWSHDLPEKNTSLTFPRHSGVDLFGVVLSGKVRVKPLEPAAKTFELGTWGAFRVPGAGVTVLATEGAARLVLAIAGDGAPIAETAARLKDRKTAKQVNWRSRPSPVATVDLAAAPDLAWGKGAMHARLGFEGGRASLGLLLASKDAPVPPHAHDAEWEILAALTADGTAKRAAAPGETDMTEIPVTDGTVVAMPKGVLHAWVPGGTKPLFAVQMYLPPGPEQRFKKLATDAQR